MEQIDQVFLNFNKDGLWLLNICLGLIMFGVALDLHVSHFKDLLKSPKSIFFGLFSQFILLPAITFGLVSIWNPVPSMALGMILVAACPGGNVSNFISSISGGNIALSVSLTVLATMLSLFLTPLNFTLWGKAYAPAAGIMSEIDVCYIELLQTVFVLLIIPMAIGMFVADRWPAFTEKIKKPIKALSLIIFAAFVGVAFSNNYDIFTAFIGSIFILVLVHNLLGFLGGYISGSIGKLSVSDRKSIIIETGIQNSGLALVITFNFFDGLGGMAIIAGWWGIWHILAGLGIASLLKKWKD